MSVTFSPVTLSPVPVSLRDLYPDMPAMGLASVDSDLDVNMSTANAGALLRSLGFVPDEEGWVGSEVPAEFLLRLEAAEAALSLTDLGVPAHELPGPGARWIECGREEGYLAARLGQLRDLAVFCEQEGFLVGWA